MKKEFIKKGLSLKRAPTSKYNQKIFEKRVSTKIDLEKAHYEAELMLDEEDNSLELRDQPLFENKHINIFKFYRHFFEPIDWLYLILALLGCLIVGLSSPIMTYLNSNVYSSVGNSSENRASLSAAEIMKLNVKDTMNKNIKKQIIYGSISLVGNFIGYFFIGLIGTRCLYNFKKKYFTLILSQEQSWFDSTNIFEFSTKIQTQLEYIELGLGEGLGKIIITCFTGAGSFIFAFFGSWKVSLVILSFAPLNLLITIIMNKMNVKGNNLVRQTWEVAGGIGEEIFYNIRTVASFANFEYELKRFYEKVEISNKIELLFNLRINLLSGLLIVTGGGIVFIAFIYGRTIIKKDFNSLRGRDVTGGDINLSYSCMLGFMGTIVDLASTIQYVLISLAATSDYFNLYERKPQMDLTNSIEKPPLSEIKGNIEFKNVNFYYPSDPNKKLILNGINLNFQAGKKIAIIGQSGCGKTTIVSLIERLYDITEGEILLDGLDIRKYDIRYLRNLIGYVEQEPILFNRTIRDNIILEGNKF